jgi:outer membrane protein OmpA-like peptidoglycan-associated protein
VNDGLIENKKWYKNYLAVITLISATIGIILTLINFLPSSKSPPKPVSVNTALVVDTSDAMRAPFDGRTRWDALSDYVSGKVFTKETASGDNLMARVMGGVCQSAGIQAPLVEWGLNNEQAIGNAIAAASPGGKRVLGATLIETLGDFNDQERFGAAKRNTVIVVTGGLDECGFEDWHEVASKRAEDVGVNLKIQFIAMNISAEEQRALSDSLAIEGDVQVINAANVSQLALAMDATTSGTLAQVQAPVLAFEAESPVTIAMVGDRLKVHEGERLVLRVKATDAQGVTPSVEFTQLPTGASQRTIDDRLELEWTPTATDVGINTLAVRASNGILHSDRELTVEVLPASSASPLSQRRTHLQAALFEFASDELTETEKAKLAAIYAEMSQVDSLTVVRITGYTDNIGSEKYNQELSERRAARVRDYLVDLGLDANITMIEGKGMVNPIASNDDKAGRLENRRVSVEFQ